MLITRKRIINLFTLIIITFLGCTNISWAMEESYWRLLKIIDKSTNEESNKRKAFIKVSVPGKSNNYHALGWVDIHFNDCPFEMMANGDLKLIKEGKNTGELITVKNLPLESIEFDNTNFKINQAFIGNKINYKGEIKPFIWIDIDGDGVDELIYSSVCGNRFSTHNTIFEYDEYANTKKLTNPVEIRDLNLSQIPKLELTSYGSGGACHNYLQTFSSINGKYVLTKYLYQKDCITQEFELVNDKWCLVKSYQVEQKREYNIENNIKFYTDEKCYFKDEFLLKYKADKGHFQ